MKKNTYFLCKQPKKAYICRIKLVYSSDRSKSTITTTNNQYFE